MGAEILRSYSAGEYGVGGCGVVCVDESGTEEDLWKRRGVCVFGVDDGGGDEVVKGASDRGLGAAVEGGHDVSRCAT